MRHTGGKKPSKILLSKENIMRFSLFAKTAVMLAAFLLATGLQAAEALKPAAI
jgi:hypothetical protein